MKRNLMNELTEGIDALAKARNTTTADEIKLHAKNQLDECLRINEKLAAQQAIINKAKKESLDIEQVLGKALGYPWFKDDQFNFPNATETDGVAVGDHTAWSLACEAADKIKELQNELDRLKASIHKLSLEEWRTFDKS